MTCKEDKFYIAYTVYCDTTIIVKTN